MKFNLKEILGKVGDIAEITGAVTGNPFVTAGGKIIGAIVDDEEDTHLFVKDLTIGQLLNLREAVEKELMVKSR